VLCALGCAVADIRYDLSRTVERPVLGQPDGLVRDILAGQRRDGEARMQASGTALETIEVSHAAEMSYQGQIHTLRVPIEPSWTGTELVAAFESVYRQEYGNTLGTMPVVIVSLKTAVLGVRRKPVMSAPAAAADGTIPAPRARRPVHFGRWIDTPIYDRADLLPGMRFDGPAIVEQPDTTSVIEPGMTARVDGHANILIEVA